MRKILLFTTVISMTIVCTILLSCEKDNEELGKQAAKEFCNCRKKGGSMDDCEKKLRKDYSNTKITSDDFLKAFNREAANCNVKLTLL